MNRRNKLGTALVVLAAVLFIVPALFPLQAVHTHDTRPGTFDGREQIEESMEIVSYENLSERGQTLYVLTLENEGVYRVPQGEGAPDFDYTASEDRTQPRDGPAGRAEYVAIERPEDADLPPADEPFQHHPEERDEPSEPRREQAQRFDVMEVSTGPPPIDSPRQLLRLAAALLAVVSLGVGGYLLSSK